MSPVRQPTSPRRGFNFSRAMRRLVADVVSRLPELAHVDLPRVMIAVSQTRKPVRHGLYASLTPMRFEGGSLYQHRRGQCYTIERLFDHGGREQLYILRFYLPRFMEVDFHEKLTTVIHELWHIGPAFDGDLRRHGGRCYAHSPSQKRYDAHMRRLADRYLSLGPPEEAIGFLRLSFAELQARYGRVVGLKVRRPKLVRQAAQHDRPER